MTSDPKGYRKQLGKRGEEIAAEFLQSKGYTIRDRNFQIREGELDLIVEVDDTLVFVEVKTVRSEAFGHPADKVDSRKQHRMILAAEAYLQKYEINDMDCRFDVIAIRIKTGNSIVEHIEDAFNADANDME
ncbi:YraN family protein [candidate division KSB1 bacterium]|nr:YraN family protein [candidate division KSB1 bacterium]